MRTQSRGGCASVAREVDTWYGPPWPTGRPSGIALCHRASVRALQADHGGISISSAPAVRGLRPTATTEIGDDVPNRGQAMTQDRRTAIMKTVSGLTFLALALWASNASAQTSIIGSGSGTVYTGNYPTPGPVPCGHYINNPCKPKATKPIKPRNARR